MWGDILQQLWFNYHPAMRLAYSTRLFGFGTTYFVALATCARLGAWLPVDNPWAWVSFSVIFLVIFAVLTLAIGAMLRRRGIEHKAKLDEYHAHKENG